MAEWNLQLAGHLLRHATFGFTASQLQQALADGPERTIERLLAPSTNPELERTMADLTPREPTPQETAQLQLYRILISDPCGTAFRLSAGLAETLRAKTFFAPENYRKKVKSPLEFALNLAIPLEVQLAPAQLLTELAQLGQHFPDPTEKRWLNAFTLIGRSNLAARILAKVKRFPDRRTLIETLLQNDAPTAVLLRLAQIEGSPGRDSLQAGRELAQAIANLPEFQLL